MIWLLVQAAILGVALFLFHRMRSRLTREQALREMSFPVLEWKIQYDRGPLPLELPSGPWDIVSEVYPFGWGISEPSLSLSVDQLCSDLGSSGPWGQAGMWPWAETIQ